MWKLQSLRALIESANPDLVRDPQNLIVLAHEGRTVSTLAGGLSFEYEYTIEITVLNYVGHTDALFVPLLAWVRVHQSELLDNPKTQAKGLEFNVELLELSSCDIAIRVPVTERVVVKADEDHPTRLIAEHPPEPGVPGMAGMAERWELYLKDQLLAQWDMEIPPERARFESLRFF
ncbi:phage tail protein [Diaphorobacter sp. HDW4A]|uniref:phage tail protein n=1 Tax=Diaphorobacter sp. HDW4A TaxID=2714924 RepID=UPI001409B18A|nr:phage tail protein [Diaphorobacter sp. HDW4A]QIL80822.1 phage tail protein [Diaphorobacter sp. HDW4A]QIL83581.1 phage tail protein [Diaphorobacter sp. HDW4A]